MDERQAILTARKYFLDDRNLYGCAETTFMVLKEAYGLPEPTDSSPAMVLNGGIAYSGNLCGALGGAALAIGLLAGQRFADHRRAKVVARRAVMHLMDEFQAQHGAINCRDLTAVDFRDEEQHRRFIESGVWRTRCMGQIETVIQFLMAHELI
jgi:C_GCAxxG_C_C family probable redox protein